VSKDLFILAKQMTGKNNPIVSALLYDFCPAAAHWYVRGAEPEEVFDVVWKAFEDFVTGKQFIQIAEEYGITTMLPEIGKFIAAVVECRSRYSKDGPSPEITHDLGIIFSNQFGLQNQLNQLGGTLGDLKHFVRVWRFLMGDWKTCMKMNQRDTSQRILQLFTVSLSAPGVVQSNLRVHMPVWGWEVRIGEARRVYLGLLVSNRKQHPLRFALVHGSDRADDKKWPNNGRPDLWALDRDTGVAEPIIVRSEAILRLIPRWHDQAQYGRNRPVGLEDKESCHFCGYRTLCYGKLPPFHPISREQDILDSALEQLTNEPIQKRQYSVSRERFSSEGANAYSK
jgi:hypothetical protein